MNKTPAQFPAFRHGGGSTTHFPAQKGEIMEETTENPKETKTLTPSVPIPPPQPAKTNSMVMMILGGMIGSIISAGSIMAYQWYFMPAPVSIVTVDLKQIMDGKRNDLIAKYKGAYTEENVVKAEKEVKAFADRLQYGIEQLGKHHTVLIKDAVLNNSVDVTEKLKAFANMPDRE